jgi:hypothetical protein
MGRKTHLTTSSNKSDGLLITKPFDAANYFNDYFIGKVGKLRQEMPITNHRIHALKKIMEEKHYKFEFCKVHVGEVERLLLSINND